MKILVETISLYLLDPNNNETTPQTITPKIRDFLAVAQLNERPKYLKFTHTSADYLVKNCLDNCLLESQLTNCEMVFGWIIWENRSTNFIEAEFHSVVKRGHKIIDITPRFDGESRILFVRDLIRFAKKSSPTEWTTWDNIKSRNGNIFNNTSPIRSPALVHEPFNQLPRHPDEGRDPERSQQSRH